MATVTKTARNLPPALDFKRLFEDGLAAIESFSSELWTDYNSHDPGVTILEYLCYALTDLGARTGLPMTTLLAEKAGDKSRLPDSFAPAHLILPSRALTANDYRKLLISLPGVRNAWLNNAAGSHAPIFIDRKHKAITFGELNERLMIKGLCGVDIEFDKNITPQGRDEALALARQTIMANRNLCEDFVEIRPVIIEQVAVCADIELTPHADVDEAMAELIFALDEFIAPSVPFHSLAEMLARGYRVEEILAGPYSEAGFIDDVELKKADNRREIRSSDLIQVLMDIPQIAAVKKLALSSYVGGKLMETGREWLLTIGDNRAPRLDRDRSRLLFYKELIPYNFDPARVEQFLAALTARHYQPPITEAERTLPLPVANWVDLTRYLSIQNHFPLNYGIGREGVAEQAPVERKIAARQLKSYLLLFEQYLADSLAQLSKVKDLLSPQPVARSYFSQLPDNAEDFADLVTDPEKIQDDHIETRLTYLARRNNFLDHLLARYGEEFNDYAILVDSLYGQRTMERLIADKERMLAHYPEMSRDRQAAYDYSPAGYRDSMSGLERKLRVLLGYGTDRDLPAAIADYYEIYQEVDLDDIDEYRFRVKDLDGRILLSSNSRFYAVDALKKVMRQVPIFGIERGNYRIMTTESGSFYFVLVNALNEVIGRKIHYVASAAACEAEIDLCLAFFTATQSDERFFVLEHLLLRPFFTDQASGDGTDPCQDNPYCRDNDQRYLLPVCDDKWALGFIDDPYSFRITVILPAWAERFKEPAFRAYIERFIREQTPAHIFAKTCWVSAADMDAFAKSYLPWRQFLALRNNDDAGAQLLPAQELLIQTWIKIRNVYPAGHLHNCREKSDKSPVVLGSSALGVMHPEVKNDT